jgi:hypothetical protein
MAKAQTKIRAAAAVATAPGFFADIVEFGGVCSRLVLSARSAALEMLAKVPTLSDTQVRALKRKLTVPEGEPLAPILASAWLSNQWLWLGAALLYTVPFSWVAMLWMARTTQLVLQPADPTLPSWCMAIAPPALETSALGAVVAGGRRVLGDALRGADELRAAPPALETSAPGALAAGGRRVRGDALRGADELRAAPPALETSAPGALAAGGRRVLGDAPRGADELRPAPPALETSAPGALAAGGRRVLGDAPRGADELRTAPPWAPACWWGMPVAIVLLGPRSVLGAAASLVIGVVATCAVVMASRVLAAQLVREAPATG